MKIGDECYVHGYVDEIRNDTIIIRNEGGYFGTVKSEIVDAPTVDAVEVIRCKDCKHYYALNEVRGNCSEYNFVEKIPIDYCSWAERKEE